MWIRPNRKTPLTFLYEVLFSRCHFSNLWRWSSPPLTSTFQSAIYYYIIDSFNDRTIIWMVLWWTWMTDLRNHRSVMAHVFYTNKEEQIDIFPSFGIMKMGGESFWGTNYWNNSRDKWRQSNEKGKLIDTLIFKSINQILKRSVYIIDLKYGKLLN